FRNHDICGSRCNEEEKEETSRTAAGPQISRKTPRLRRRQTRFEEKPGKIARAPDRPAGGRRCASSHPRQNQLVKWKSSRTRTTAKLRSAVTVNASPSGVVNTAVSWPMR